MNSSQSIKKNEGIVALVNDMLGKLHVSIRVQHWSEVNSDLFITIMEGLMAETLPDVIRPARSREDEVHNVQVVIDTLSLDILNTSMSHITGDAVVDGDRQAIANLLDVLCGLMEYLLDKIGSDISSTDNDDDLESIDDPDLVTPDVIDDILERELRQGNQSIYSLPAERPSRDMQHSNFDDGERSKNGVDTTADLIALGNVSGYNSLRENKGETTEQLIALGHERTPATLGQRATNDSRTGTTEHMHSSDLEKGYVNTRMQHERAIPSRNIGILDGGIVPGNITCSENVTGPVLSGLDSHKFSSNNSDYLAGKGNAGGGPLIQTVPTTHGTFVSGANRDKRLPVTTPTITYGSSIGLSSSKDVVSGLDSSLASSSVAFPQPVISNGTGSNEFAAVGLPRSSSHPLSTMPADLTSLNTRSGDPASKNYTYHLYHHFEKDMPKSDHMTELSTVPVIVSSNSSRCSTGLPAYSSTRTDATTNVTSSSAVQAKRHSSTVGDGTSQPCVNTVTQPPYTNLQSLMQDTVAMSRAAVSNGHRSPLPDESLLKPSDPQTSVDMLSQQLRSNLSHVRQEAEKSGMLSRLSNSQQSDQLRRTTTSTEGRLSSSQHSRLSASLNQSAGQHSTNTSILHSSELPQSILSPGPRILPDRERRKVSFLTGKSADESRINDHNIDNMSDPSLHSNLRKSYEIPHRSKTAKKKKVPTGGSSKSKSVPRPHLSSGKSRIAHELSSREQPVPTPKSFQEYLHKYYTHIPHDRLQSLSDSEVDYNPDRLSASHDADISDIESEASMSRRLTGGKSVRFEDLPEPAKGPVHHIRHKIMQEDQHAKIKAQYLGSGYSDGLVGFAKDMNEELDRQRSRAYVKDLEYRENVTKASHNLRSKTSKKKSVPVTSVLYDKPRSRTCSKQTTRSDRRRKRSASASPSLGRFQSNRNPSEELLPWLLEEFPYLHLSTETLHDMWKRSTRQLHHLSNAEENIRRKKTKAQIQIEEAERKQNVLLNIVKKEVSHTRRVRELKERQHQQHSLKAKLRERRQQSARSRRYYDEYQLHMRAKMLKKRTKEELIFKKLFREGLDVQKERIHDLRKYAKEQREKQALRQKDELSSLENYYRDQFSILAERMTKEQQEVELRESAQQQILHKMKRALRHKLEREVQDIQQQICHDEDDAYFREVDAQRLQRQVQLMRYTANV